VGDSTLPRACCVGSEPNRTTITGGAVSSVPEPSNLTLLATVLVIAGLLRTGGLRGKRATWTQPSAAEQFQDLRNSHCRPFSGAGSERIPAFFIFGDLRLGSRLISAQKVVRFHPLVPVCWGCRSTGGLLVCTETMRVRFSPSPPRFACVAEMD
jgi:hypothetical protein